MPRTFTAASSEYIGFAPKAWDAWGGVHVYMIGRKTGGGTDQAIYYAGASGGGTVGNVQLGVTNLNDDQLGVNGTATQFAGTVPSGTTTGQTIGASKATGTATPRADYTSAPYTSAGTHSNMAATLGDPVTSASAVEEVGRWNGASQYWGGDIEWVGVWGFSPQMSANETEGLPRIAPRFLAGLLHGCQRFWWFNQFITDTVADRSNHGADQIAITGTTHTTTGQPLAIGLLGTTFSIVPGVL